MGGRLDETISRSNAKIAEAVAEQTNAVLETRRSTEWGLAMIHEQSSVQTSWIKAISKQLDGIARVLQTPKRTRSRELIAEGHDLMLRGHYHKALDRFDTALKLDDVDFQLHLLRGKLLLYGRNARESVVSLPGAVESLSYAMEYASTERTAAEAAREVQTDAQRHLGIALFVSGREARRAGDDAAANRHLQSAVQVLQPSRSRGATFVLARCLAALGRDDEATALVRAIADGRLGYAQLAARDADLGRIEAIQHLTGAILEDPGPLTKQALDALRGAENVLSRIEGFRREGVEPVPVSEWKQSVDALHGQFTCGVIDYQDVVSATEQIVAAARSRWRGALEARRGALATQLDRVRYAVDKARSKVLVPDIGLESMAIKWGVSFVVLTILIFIGEMASGDAEPYASEWFPALALWGHSLWLSLVLAVGVPELFVRWQQTIADSIEEPVRAWLPALEEELGVLGRLRASGEPVTLPRPRLPGPVPPGPKLGEPNPLRATLAVSPWILAPAFGVLCLLGLQARSPAPASLVASSSEGDSTTTTTTTTAESAVPTVGESVTEIRRRFARTNSALPAMRQMYVSSPPAIQFLPTSGHSPEKVVRIRAGDQRRGISEYYLQNGRAYFIYAHGFDGDESWSERLYYDDQGMLIRRLANGRERSVSESQHVSEPERQALDVILALPSGGWQNVTPGSNIIRWLAQQSGV
jgi:tetratricopeptide (TPR) repeat protein